MRQVLVVGLLVLTFLIAASAVFWRSTEPNRQAQNRTASPYLPQAPVQTAGPTPEKDGRVVTEVTPESKRSSAHETAPVAVAMPKLPAAPVAPQWEVAFQDAFNDAEAAKRVFPLGGGVVSYFEPKQALLLRSPEDGDTYAAIHKALPGDLRVRFKALRAKSAEEVSIGFFFSNNGNPTQMDGYFAEWARGIAQLKRERRVLKQVDAHTPKTDDRWVNLELRKVGGAITMLLEGQEVLAYTDPQPLTDAEHDLCAFYVWAEHTLIRDVVIERNHNDSIQPLQTDPASKANLLDGARTPDRDKPADF